MCCAAAAGACLQARRFVPYNGGLGAEQIRWLRGVLSGAAARRERVIVLCHVILHPRACDGSTMAWDFHRALGAIREAGCVVAVLCGHDHKGKYHRDEQGVHHLTFCSPLNLGEAGHAYGLVRVHADRMEVVGPNLAELLPNGGEAAGLARRRSAECEGCEVIALPWGARARAGDAREPTGGKL